LERLLKVMKALAEYHDLTLGDLVEGNISQLTVLDC